MFFSLHNFSFIFSKEQEHNEREPYSSAMNFILRAASSFPSLLSCLAKSSPSDVPAAAGRHHYTNVLVSSSYPKWYHSPRNILVVAGVFCAGAASLYYGRLESVPFTKRTHFVILSPPLERSLGESEFEDLKAELRSEILPPDDTDSVRVGFIADRIIGTLRPAKKEDSNSSRDEGSLGQWLERGLAAPTWRFNELNWEVVVVRDSMVNAMCLPGGKIVVYTGLLDYFKTDTEVATIIGHEVGHAIARHYAEIITNNLWLAILQQVVMLFIKRHDLIDGMSNLLLKLPFLRRMEMEADYIGILLLAAAGYDPRKAPEVYEKLGQIAGGDSFLEDYHSTHPSSKKRAQLLSQDKVMQEALNIYHKVVSRHKLKITC